MNKMKKGFTLIELLVVIAIIGILASVVLASLNTARSKGGDAAIKADMSGIRATAEVEYDNLGLSYNTGAAITGSACASVAGSILANSNIQSAIAHANSINDTDDAYCNVTGSGYAIAIELKTPGSWWCVDSTGQSKGTQGTGTTGYTARDGAATAALTNNADVVCN